MVCYGIKQLICPSKDIVYLLLPSTLPFLASGLPPHIVQYLEAAVNLMGHFLYVEPPIKVKFTPEQATKAQRGSRCLALLFL